MASLGSSLPLKQDSPVAAEAADTLYSFSTSSIDCTSCLHTVLFCFFPAWFTLPSMFSFPNSFLLLIFPFQYHILQGNVPCLPREAYMFLCFLSQSIINFPFCYSTCVIISAQSNFIKVVGSVSVGSMFVSFFALFLGSAIIPGSN